MYNNKGTPKALIEAIENGLLQSRIADTDNERAKEIARHIRDYVANKISPMMFNGTKEDIEAVKKLMGFFEL